MRSLFVLLLPMLILLGAGILAIVGLLIWRSIRPKQPRRLPKAAQPRSGAQEQASRADWFLALRRGQDRWEVYVDGRRYPTLTAVPDAEVRAEVVAALRALAGFARTYVQTQAHEQGSSTEATAAPVESRDDRRGTSQDLAPPDSATAAEAAVTWSEPPSRRVAAPAGTVPAIDLAQEIGDILEEMKARNPALQSHSVHLANVPGGGIRFAVDGSLYHEIDEIPTPEIRDLIRQATREWERR